MKLFTILVITISLSLSGCTALNDYNSHVAARQYSISGYSKDNNYGGAFTHRVEYRP